MAWAHDTEKGEMDSILFYLMDNSIEHACFYEPDLNYALTSICFLADERVYNYEKYPDYSEDIFKSRALYSDTLGGIKNYALRELIRGRRLA